MPSARNATLRMSLPAARTARGLIARGAGGRSLVARSRHEDEDVVEAREVDRGGGVHVLIAAELALDDLRDPGDGDAAGEPAALAARHQEIADLDVVARVDHLDLAAVARRVSGAADEASRPRALVLHVDPEGGVHGELDVDRVAGDVQHRADDAVGRDDRHVRAHVARSLVEHDAGDAEELREVLADDLRADRVSGGRVLELEQAPELAALDLGLLE